MTKCEDCKNEYFKIDSCPFPYVSIEGNVLKRNQIFRLGQGFSKNITENERCEECGVLKDLVHHFGCSVEVCPICKDSLPTCACDEVFVMKDRHERGN
jgi:hypothetical protein